MKADKEMARKAARYAKPPRNIGLWKPIELVRYGYEQGYAKAKREQQTK